MICCQASTSRVVSEGFCSGGKSGQSQIVLASLLVVNIGYAWEVERAGRSASFSRAQISADVKDCFPGDRV